MSDIDTLLDDLCGLGLPDIEFIIEVTIEVFMSVDLVEETKECRGFKNINNKGLILVKLEGDKGLYVFSGGDWIILDLSRLSSDKCFDIQYGRDFKKDGNKINLHELSKVGKSIRDIQEPIKKIMEGPLEDYRVINLHLYLLKELNINWDE